MKVLSGHISFDTAFVISDYPFGFRLRCQKKMWIETTARGSRLVSQTSDPRKPTLIWNAPKKSTYHNVMVLVQLTDVRDSKSNQSSESDLKGEQDKLGHVEFRSVSMYSKEEELLAFEKEYASALTDRDKKELQTLKLFARASSKITYKVSSGNEPQSLKDSRAILSKVLSIANKEILAEQKVSLAHTDNSVKD